METHNSHPDYETSQDKATLRALADQMLEALVAMQIPETFNDIARAARAAITVDRLLTRLYAKPKTVKSPPKETPPAKPPVSHHKFLEEITRETKQLTKEVRQLNAAKASAPAVQLPNGSPYAYQSHSGSG